MDTSCHLVAAGTEGYGFVNVGGRVQLAHRYAWIQTHGPIPDGLFVLHRCDVRNCVNVEHLFLGTHQDNMDDMVAKGRQTHGERHHKARLTEAAVRALRAGSLTITQAATQFGVSPQAAGMAKRGQTWSHL